MSEAKLSPGDDFYERDEHEWIAVHISALESGQLNRLDRENLIGFLSEMTLRDRRELRSRLTVLLLSVEGPVSTRPAFRELGEHDPDPAEREQIADSGYPGSGRPRGRHCRAGLP